jgi:DNA-directed RNA polymerase specialized sigma24 family protein
MSGSSRAAPRVDPAIAEMLLAAVAAAPSGPIATVFDNVLYPFVRHFAEARAPSLAQRSLRRLGGKDVYLPGVLPQDLEAIAHDTATLALERLRANAAAFDRRKGDVLSWIGRAALFAYSDVVRKFYGKSREILAPKDDDDPIAVAAAPSNATNADDRILVEQLLAPLNDDQRHVIVLRYRLGFTYEEMAEMMFGDRTQVKKLEHLLTGAVEKMRDVLNRNRA